MNIKSLPAFNGDSFLVSFSDKKGVVRNILIDGGTPRTYRRHLKPELEAILKKGQSIDLLIVTHIDDDHIGGIKELYQDTSFDRSFIKNIWFNSGILLFDFFQEGRDENREVKIIMDDQTEMSVGQGVTLENALLIEGRWQQDLIHTGIPPFEFYGAKITILSPGEDELKKLHKRWEIETEGQVLMSGENDDFDIPISELIEKPFQEDKAVPNGSSIALLFEYAGVSLLLLGDAHPSVIERSLRKLGYSEENMLNVDLVKVSHHSSKKNTSPALLAIIKSEYFMISTDGNRHGLPDKEAMARIISANSGCNLYFNYDSFMKKLFSDVDQRDYSFYLHSLSLVNYTINF